MSRVCPAGSVCPAAAADGSGRGSSVSEQRPPRKTRSAGQRAGGPVNWSSRGRRAVCLRKRNPATGKTVFYGCCEVSLGMRRSEKERKEGEEVFQHDSQALGAVRVRV